MLLLIGSPRPELAASMFDQAIDADDLIVSMFAISNGAAACNCSGLQLIRYSSEARLEEIMQIHNDYGVGINTPHVFIIEDGKQARLDPAVVEMKGRFDPQGLLNPGKLRSWEAR